MKTPTDSKPTDAAGKLSDSMKSNIAMLMFGVATLMFLIAIDHKEWFTLRPVSGSAVAISYVSDHDAARRNVEAAQEKQQIARP